MSFIHSIKFRFTLWYLLILAATLILLCVVVYSLLSQTLYRSLDDSLEKNTVEMSRNPTLYRDVSEGDIKQTPRDLLMLCFYSGDKLVKLSPNSRFTLDDETVDRVIRAKRLAFTADLPGAEKLRCFGTQLPRENEDSVPRILPPGSEKRPVVLITGRPVEPIEESLNELLSVFMIAIPLCLVIAGGMGIFLARRVLKPVEDITSTAREIEEHDLSRRIDVKTSDELGRLAITLNQMIDRLEKAFERQRQFTGDASHELRAPLAVIQAESTLTLQREREPTEYRQSLESISQEVENMVKIIEQLLTLARSDAGQEAHAIEHVDLGEMLRGLAADFKVVFNDKGLSLELDTGNKAVVEGDVLKLKRLFANVLDNAARYTPGGGTISITLFADKKDAVVRIRDTGVGISPEHLPFIFNRFYRVDKARSRADGGSGLGLAICRQIAEEHGGEIYAESEVGKGSSFSVKLPLAHIAR